MTTTGTETPLTQSRLFWFWIPLFLSWLLMTAEGPIIHAALTRLPDSIVTLAAFGIVMSLSVTIESPVIMLLSTSTALADRWSSYLVLRRFTIHLNIAMTVVALLFGFCDPFYDALVLDLLKVPEKIAEAAQEGMKIMVLWSAAIGWRRFHQGLLIRYGATRQITIGTAIRCFFAISSAFTAGFVFEMSGVRAGSIGLMSGVLTEALFIHWATGQVKREKLAAMPEQETTLSYGDVARFHLPLAATSIMSLLAQPLITAGLARMDQPERSLAAWPVIFSMLLIFRSPAFAIPELVIAKTKALANDAVIRRFCFSIAFLSSGIMALLLIFPGMEWLLLNATGLKPELTELALVGLLACVTMPFFQTIKNWQRGILMTRKETGHIYWGMAMNLGLIVVLVALGVWQGWSGVTTGGAALAAATALESAYLYLGTRRGKQNSQLA
ncbi:MAG: hypothetical protein P1V97_11075 [Planctomycetota bacterium]|nr:hypothetical protein [Planctomycetota bacterium]